LGKEKSESSIVHQVADKEGEFENVMNLDRGWTLNKRSRWYLITKRLAIDKAMKMEACDEVSEKSDETKEDISDDKSKADLCASDILLKKTRLQCGNVDEKI
jgi:hypothetical protein